MDDEISRQAWEVTEAVMNIARVAVVNEGFPDSSGSYNGLYEAQLAAFFESILRRLDAMERVRERRPEDAPKGGK